MEAWSENVMTIDNNKRRLRQMSQRKLKVGWIGWDITGWGEKDRY